MLADEMTIVLLLLLLHTFLVDFIGTEKYSPEQLLPDFMPF